MAEVVGNVITVESVPLRVSPFVTANVLALVSVNVPVDAVSVRPFMLVAAATPRIGVVSVGDVANTSNPLPVSFVTRVAKFALLGVPMNVRNPAAVVFALHAPAPSLVST